MPTLYIIAGPNGAGKTTASKLLLPDVFQVSTFINADEIAAKLNAQSPESVAIEADRKMLIEITACLERRISFAIETTLATKSYVSLVQKAQKFDYDVTLVYFWLETPELAIERVARRVRKGGHYISDDVVIRRYYSGIKNLLNRFLPIVDKWIIFDNSDYTEGQPERIAEKLMDKSIIIENSNLWNKLHNHENS